MSQQRILSIVAVLAIIISIGAVSLSLNLIQAQEGETFSASLSGKDEVPPTESSATGWAKFLTDVNGTEVSYWVNMTGLNEITGTHIHNGSAGQNGDIVVTLSQQESAKDGDNATLSLKGNITKDNLEGPLKGKELSELVSLMSDGNVYVNVHTDEFKNGAIRGQIASGLPQMETNTGSTESNNTNTTSNLG
ncbi:MAG TPA: CHRD domain-containing protein [Nitrososphaeraceae archaeon]|nr:CHRD domain-containing protein [Nitrososphaeraceae archaeon]